MMRRQQGFTLVELIIVIVIMAVLAVSTVLFIRPAMQSYADTRVRADLTDRASTSLNRMLADIRVAVPNSLRIPNDQCFEVMPTSTGGRYRMGPDTVDDTALYIDPGVATTAFDSLSALSPLPAVGDWIVINNQSANDAYAGSNRTAITAIAASPQASQGKHRISMNALQVSNGYDGGRFVVVPNSEQAVFYVCSGADGDLDSAGNGKGILYRLKGYGFNATYPATCPDTSSATKMASNVRSCAFVYDPNQGATQQSGFMWMDLTISRNNETVHLAVGAHVMNAP